MIIGIQDEILKIHFVGLLGSLLADKTTKSNILWATDAYQDQGVGYQRDKEITVELITGDKSGIIKNRARKALEQQSERTRRHGEVFTPLWVCEKMNNHIDEIWFGKPDVFTKDGQPTEQVLFPKRQKWQHYVDERRLEIACGEAPYLVSRYDVATGEVIPIENRIGILDRKLRVVGENTADEAEWLKWTVRAFQATYGYEFQGDNLLIARVNLLMTFEEYLRRRWKRKPTEKEYKTIVNIIAWNLWQMDGLSGTVPYCKAPEEYQQMTLFDWWESEEYQKKAEEQPRCRIYDWRGDRSLEYKEVNMGGRNMKFSYLIGNPPYQESDGGSGASATPIYNKFIECAKQLEPDVISLIIPAKWYSGGKGLDKFREQMLNDKRIAVLVDYSNSLDVFPNVDVAGGICYFIWKKSHDGMCKYTNYRNGIETTECRYLNEFDTFIRYPIAANIVKKIKAKEEKTLDSVVSSRKPFGLATNVKPLSVGDVKLRYNAGMGFYQRNMVTVGRENIDKYKVIISYLTAEHAGQPDKKGQYKILSTMELLPPNAICSETYLLAGAFDTEIEANHYMEYLKTRFVRFLISLLAMTQHISRAMFKFVPIQDFSRPWTDSELYEKYGLSQEEIAFIQSLIKEMV